MHSSRSVMPVIMAALGLLAACVASDEPPRAASTESEMPRAPDTTVAFAEAIGKAHGLEAWRDQRALRADIVVRFGGNVILDAEMLMATDMSRTRFEKMDGSVAIWDGTDAWVSPADAEFPRARFHVLTWPYFLSAPMKLRDPGTRLESLGDKELTGTTYEAARLTFEPGTGDTPDDWYVLYRDLATNRLRAMAYIVTYGTTIEQAAQEPHAISYGGFTELDGVQIPTRWSFWLWNEEDGIHGEPIGTVTLDDVDFVAPDPELFEVPGDAAKQELPSS